MYHEGFSLEENHLVHIKYKIELFNLKINHLKKKKKVTISTFLFQLKTLKTTGNWSVMAICKLEHEQIQTLIKGCMQSSSGNARDTVRLILIW